MPKYDSLELGADSQLKYFAGYTTQGGTALTLPELNGSSIAVPITSTPLAASANFTGTTQDRLNVTAGATAVSGGIPLSQQGGVLVSKVKGSIYSDQAGTLYVEESNDNSTWTQTTTLAVSAGIFMDTGWVYLSKRYYRLRYANGATAQNTFALFQSVGAGQSDVQLMGSNISLSNASYDQTLNLATGSGVSVTVTPPTGYLWRLKQLYLNIPAQTGTGQYQLTIKNSIDSNMLYASVLTTGTNSTTIQAWVATSSGATIVPSDVNVMATSLQSIQTTNAEPLAINLFNNTGAAMTGTFKVRALWEAEATI